VADISEQRLEEKKNKVLEERNIKQTGATLKYGLNTEKRENEEIKIILSQVKHIPVFFI